MANRHLLLQGLEDGPYDCDSDEGTAEHGVNNQQKEVFMIPEANAVHDPRAMMVHLQDTRLANPAMVTPIRFVDEAVFATPPFTRKFHLLGDIWILKGTKSPGFALWHVSRHSERCPKITHQKQGGERLANEEVSPAAPGHLVVIVGQRRVELQ